ncbi:hypothetical protein BH10BAC1_BH10BAC1_17750 [soil metagenome]
MRTFLTLVLLFVCGISFAQSQIKFEKDTVDIGIVNVETDSLGYAALPDIPIDFPYVNAGNEPLIITNAIGNGNGLAVFSKDPLLPKQKGIIKARFTRFQYTNYLKKDEELRPFVTSIIIYGNFPEGKRAICLKGSVKKVKKK